jgi:predicted nucleotidyltransferase
MRSSVSRLAPIFRSHTQAELLAAIYLRPEQRWTLAALARELEVAPSTLHAEIHRLEQAGLINASEIGRARMLTPNADHPIFEPLTEILSYMFGPPTVIAEEFATLPGVERVLIFGSWAARMSGEPGPPPRDIDILLIGEADRVDVYAAADRAQERIGMPINPVLASAARWTAASDGLIREIKASPVIEITPDALVTRKAASR